MIGKRSGSKSDCKFTDRNGSTKGSDLYQGVAFLFGRDLVKQAERVNVEQLLVEAELVAEGARQLRQASGNPDRQRSIIRAMDEETALALCRWILEPRCMAAFIARGVH